MSWDQTRLRRLFDRYDQKYFFGKLSHYRIVIASLEDHLIGRCEFAKRTIIIDVNKHHSDRELRGTVLHEMAHAAALIPGHGIQFFAQVERLLRDGAPITVTDGCHGAVRIMANLVPVRFPLLKRKVDRLEARRAKPFVELIKAKRVPVHDVTEEEILERFCDIDAGAAMTWKNACVVIGIEYALTDDRGRPLTAFARRVIAKARSKHYRARRGFQEDQKRWAALPPEPQSAST